MMTEEPTTTFHFDRYYTCEQSLINRLKRNGRKMAFCGTGKEDAIDWQQKFRAKLSELLGLHNMEASDLQPRVTERVDMSGYIRERIEVQTEPDVTAVFYMLIPNDIRPGERRPVVLAPHGHGSGGKLSTGGRYDIPAAAKAIEEFNYTYALSSVKEGWIAICPDARGFGERRESQMQGDDESVFLHSSCHQLTHMALPLGQTVAGMWVWDLMRLIDYTETRQECDVNRIACAGLSGGGLQTLYLTALDERVKCAVVSGYFYGVRDSLLSGNFYGGHYAPLKVSENCCCNYIPSLWLYADMGDIGALCAPRSLFIETGDEDPLNGKRGVVNTTEQTEITRKAYATFNAEDRFHHAIFHGPHRWDGVEALPWMKKWLSSGCK